MTPTLTLDDIVSKTADLPTLPAATLKVLRETTSATVTAQSLARAISQDQALTMRVLRLANSAFYGLSRQVSDISEAVVVLGTRAIRNLCLVASTYPWMMKPLKGYELGPKAMWEHALGVGVGAQLIARRSRSNEGIAFTAGLLHNLGKVAMSVWLENKLPAMMQIAIQTELPFDTVERKVLGFDHAEVGAFMGDKWNLPIELLEVMRYHHHPGDLRIPNPLVDCTHFADYLVMSLGLGLGGDGLRYDFDDRVLSRLGVTASEVDLLADEFITSYKDYEKLFEEVGR